MINGRWRLIHFETQTPSGQHIQMSEGQTGTLEYRDDGFMSVEIDRELDAMAAAGLDPQYKHLQYKGRWVFDAKTSQVAHHVEEASVPQLVGQTLTRKVSQPGNRLVLSGIGADHLTKLVYTKED